MKHLGFPIFMVSIKNMHDTITNTNIYQFGKVNLKINSRDQVAVDVKTENESWGGFLLILYFVFPGNFTIMNHKKDVPNLQTDIVHHWRPISYWNVHRPRSF